MGKQNCFCDPQNLPCSCSKCTFNKPPNSKFAQGRLPGQPMGESQPPSLTYLPHTVTPLSQVSYSLMPTTLFCTSTSKLLDNPTHIYVLCSMSPMLLPFPCPHCLFVRLYIANSLKYNEIPKLPFSSFSHQNILCEPLLLFSTCKKGKLLVIT